MNSNAFDCNVFRMVEALQYLSDCSEWLATGDNMGYIAYELGPELISQIVQQAEGIVQNLRSVRDLARFTTGMSPELQTTTVNELAEPEPLRFRVSVDITKLQGTTTQAAGTLRNLFVLYNKLLPINRLPPELLGAIFEHTMDAPLILMRGEIDDLPHCSWPNVQSVCRRWRSVAIRTPALWNYICVRKRYYSSTHHGDQENLIENSIDRSGALPLTVTINNINGHLQDDTVFNKTLADDLLPIASRIHQLRLRRYFHPKILDLFAFGPNDFKLEALILDRPHSATTQSAHLFKKWMTPPRLQTLCVSEYTGWTTAPFHTLRHLILARQTFRASSLIALHTILLLNAHLEDLVLDSVSVSADGGSEFSIKALSPVNMPHLRRISIATLDDSVPLKYLVERKLRLQPGHAKLYTRIDPVSLPQLFPPGSRCFSPSHRLFIGNDGRVVGTDSHSSFAFHTDPVPYKFLQRYFQDPHTDDTRTQELWLWAQHKPTLPSSNGLGVFNESRVPRYWRTALDILQCVTKLVLLHDIPAWLDFISEYQLLPALSTLQLHVRHLPDASPVMGFLESRASAGRPVDTLRFVLDSPDEEALESFMFCEENIAVFEHVARHVIFDSPRDHPPRMELPEVCLTNSSVHPWWTAWDVE